MVVFNNIIAGASGATSGAAAGYEITRSLRFNSADSAYLNRTPSSAGNRKTWTWSAWLKRSKIGVEAVFGLYTPSISPGQGTEYIRFNTADTIDWFVFNNGSSWTGYLKTTQVFRDPNAWYHFVCVVDLTNSTSTDRLKLYVNGIRVTEFQTANYPATTDNTAINAVQSHQLGGTTSQYFDGYLADVHFIDGQALAPTDFGEYDDNNVWQPKEYSGTYGTNGFYLKFDDNSSNSALGTDSSGNGNDWTVNNISAQTTSAANINYDSSWTVTTNNAGVGTATINGNVASAVSSKWSAASSASPLSTNSVSTAGFTTGSAVNTFFGLGKKLTTNYNATIRDSTQSYGLYTGWTGSNTNNPGGHGSSITATGFGNGDLIKFEVDPVNSTLKTYKNGVLQATDTLSSSFVSAIQNGDIYWQSDQYNTGSITLTNGEIDATTDSLIDTPTNYTADSGNNGGNYCTWNPLDQADATLSNGNLDCSVPGSTDYVRGTLAVTSGKYYWEVTLNSGVHGMIGISDQHYTDHNINYTQGVLVYYVSNGNIYGNVGRTGGASSYGSGLTSGDILGVALDMDNGNIKFYKNGVAESASNANTSSLVGLTISPVLTEGGGAMDTSTNFGQRPFAYTPPTGHLSLCTTNLPDPTIADGSTSMDAVAYTGTGGTQTISSLNFSPDFVWIKSRSIADQHCLFDIVRGALARLQSNSTNAEATINQYGSLTAFNSDGFTLTAGSSSSDQTHGSGNTYIGWAWDGGTSTVSNTDGSITSSVRANASAGFSIVSYSGANSVSTVGHGLGAAPGMFVVKRRSPNGYGWIVYHSALGASNMVALQNTSAAALDFDPWDQTAPTSSVFTVNTTGSGTVNASGADYIAYCFAPVEGYSAFGSYTGNGSADGPFVYTGFRPKFVLGRRSDSTGNWWIYDTERSEFNEVNAVLLPNTYSAEITYPTDTNIRFDILSNGFKQRNSSAAQNASGGTYIYAAFAEHPFKTARAR